MDMNIKTVRREITNKFVEGAVFEQKDPVSSATLNTVVLIEFSPADDQWLVLQTFGCGISYTFIGESTLACWHFRGIAKTLNIEMEV